MPVSQTDVTSAYGAWQAAVVSANNRRASVLLPLQQAEAAAQTNYQLVSSALAPNPALARYGQETTVAQRDAAYAQLQNAKASVIVELQNCVALDSAANAALIAYSTALQQVTPGPMKTKYGF